MRVVRVRSVGGSMLDDQLSPSRFPAFSTLAFRAEGEFRGASLRVFTVTADHSATTGTCNTWPNVTGDRT